ncbi:hypothetical protein [Streptomyces sulphureus]|uniref:hypothetical protein n=1 Tax=Streptomyces sulphureus TaxID=47758 RepID=UPI00036977CB|nr:hypothetical protein [Streptomyces sulphureus]
MADNDELAQRENGGEPAKKPSVSDEPDVLLDVPNLHVEEIDLEVEDLRARVSLQAEVLELLKLNVGADATLGKVRLEIKGVEAQALLKVRLDHVASVIDRVLTTIDRNPQILEQVASGAGSAVNKVAGGASDAVSDVGGGAGQAVGEVGSGASKAVGDVGGGAGEAASEVGGGAREATKEVGSGAGRAANGAGQAAGQAGQVAQAAGGADGAVEGVTRKAGEAAGQATEAEGRRGGSDGGSGRRGGGNRTERRRQPT